MSLFRVRDFWTFNLDELTEHYESLAGTISSVGQATDINKDASATTEPEADQAAPTESLNGGAGSFVVSLGRFHSIGKQDVFVCANLDGFICVIQVPENKQPKNDLDTKQDKPSSLGDNIAQRQLLCANKLDLPIVDVKCGHFTSTLKQSIAVLSFDKLIVYQVKKRQLDLLTAGPISPDQSQSPDSGGAVLALDESLFSHKLEEHHRIDLIEYEFASNIIILNTNNSNQNYPSEVPDQAAHQTTEPTRTHTMKSSILLSSSHNRNKQPLSKQLQLPQRDLIIIQYHNQFLFTIIDHKKVVGHFSLGLEDPIKAHNDASTESSRTEGSHLEQLSQFMGSMPMAFIRNSKGLLSLALTTSDNKVHCLQVSKLMALAKQSVMKRVAMDLLQHDGHSNQESLSHTKPLVSSLSYDNQTLFMAESNSTTRCRIAPKITIDLSSMADWALELAYSPIQMDFIQRFRAKSLLLSTSIASDTSSTAASHANHLPQSQLLVTSRYYIDLFTSSGDHLWSQRFENPLICLSPYILPTFSETEPNTRGQDRLMGLVCTDCLSTEKCNLLVVDEERIAWSASLNNRPTQLWRVNLSKISGAIVALDSNRGQLSMSYLGTNSDTQDEQLELEAAEGAGPECQLDQMDLLDEFPANLDGGGELGDCSNDSSSIDGNCKLEVDICLEAINQWPDVQVSSCIKIRPEANSSVVIQNIVATLEFDDLIHFESTDSQTQTISSSVIQVPLGSCWPDRREPLSFTGHFSMHPTTSLSNRFEIGGQAAGMPTKQVRDVNLMPKSLKVKLFLRFNILHSGPLLQEEFFMLPMNMVARLAHIDYSSGQNQTLDDVLANLNMYERQPSGFFHSLDTMNPSETPYYLCDLFINSDSDIVEIVDDIIESDLVCRGFNSETKSASLLRPQDRKERDMSTLENINLLAQSLDCRLKYKSLAHSSTSVVRQSSEEYSPAIMISIALKVSSGAHIMQGLSNGQTEAEHPYVIVWLHLCDLSLANNSILSQEFVKLHSREWKAHEYVDKSSGSSDDVDLKSKHPILISIECDHPMPILLLQTHLIERLKRRATRQSGCQFKINALSESMHDAIEINCNEIVKLDNFIAISTNLYDCLSSTVVEYDKSHRCEFRRLKDELAKEYCKFHISTMTSLSLSKRLINLPDRMHQQFTSLSMLTKQYQLNLMRILGELERLKRLDYQYCKVPEASYIVPVEGRDVTPHFVQIID